MSPVEGLGFFFQSKSEIKNQKFPYNAGGA
jgi:hypothetical protein